MSKNKTLSLGTADFLLLIGAGAIVSGILFIVQPDGSLLSLTVDKLKNSPFDDFFYPGIILLVMNGILSIVGALLLFFHYRYAGVGVMLLGAAMIVWVAAQLFWMGWGSWLQGAFLVVGILELAAGFFLESQYHDNWRLFGGHHDSHVH